MPLDLDTPLHQALPDHVSLAPASGGKLHLEPRDHDTYDLYVTDRETGIEARVSVPTDGITSLLLLTVATLATLAAGRLPAADADSIDLGYDQLADGDELSACYGPADGDAPEGLTIEAIADGDSSVVTIPTDALPALQLALTGLLLGGGLGQ